ncbi:MAG: hypothetical protein ABIL25_01000 [candidate division WOR-3 bacterium]
MKIWLGLLILMVVAVSAGLAAGNQVPREGRDAISIPQLINYQGKLTDGSGKPLSGTYGMKFEIYDHATGGTKFWEETQPDVAVTDGLFSVKLGSVDAIDPATELPEGPNCWLQVTVGTTVIEPRVQLVSVPYTYKSDDAAKLGGTAAADYATKTWVTGQGFELQANKNAANGYCGLDAGARVPNSRLYTGSGNGLDADLLDGKHASEFVAGSGSSGYIPKWAAAGTLDNSLISQNGNAIGIGCVPGPGSPVALEVYNNGPKPVLYVHGSELDRNFTGHYADYPAFATHAGSQGGYPVSYGMGQVLGGLGIVAKESNPNAFGNIQFFTGNSLIGYPGAERMRITYDGKVGIGTTSPSAPLHVIGNFIASGTKSAMVTTPTHGNRKLYCVEAATVKFTDEGTARLNGGSARVNIDPIFLETIEGELLVHLTPYGPTSLYVAERGTDYFVVRSLDSTDVEFAWHVSACRKGYGSVRLEEVR